MVWRIEVEAAEDAAAVVTEDEGAAGDALGAFGGGGLDEVLEVCDVAGIDFFGEVEGGVDGVCIDVRIALDAWADDGIGVGRVIGEHGGAHGGPFGLFTAAGCVGAAGGLVPEGVDLDPIFSGVEGAFHHAEVELHAAEEIGGGVVEIDAGNGLGDGLRCEIELTVDGLGAVAGGVGSDGGGGDDAATECLELGGREGYWLGGAVGGLGDGDGDACSVGEGGGERVAFGALGGDGACGGDLGGGDALVVCDGLADADFWRYRGDEVEVERGFGDGGDVACGVGRVA